MIGWDTIKVSRFKMTKTKWGVMKSEDTEEMKKLNELRKLDEGVADYIEITLNLLMEYGMSEQEASISIIKRFKRVLNN